MRQTLCVILCCLSFSCTQAQDAQRGIRNTGILPNLQVEPARVAIPGDSNSDGVKRIYLVRRLTLVDLYPGAAAIRQQYTWENRDSIDHTISLSMPAPVVLPQAGIGNLFPLEPQRMQWADSGTAALAALADSSLRMLPARTIAVPAGQTVRVQFHALLQTNLARFIAGNSSRDGNAMGITLAGSIPGADSSLVDEIFLRMNEGINLTNIWGILPAGKTTGNLQYLRFAQQGPAADSLGQFLVWYEGAAPDFKFDKKVVPIADTLFAAVDAMPLALFGDPAFTAVDRNNFSLAPSGLTLTGILYFALFTVPWIILAWFVISLLRRKKK